MDTPKFLLADNSKYPEDIFVLHTEFPRFLLNLANDELVVMEEVENENDEELAEELEKLTDEAIAFYESEMESYEDEESF